jgi:hypothetical protein
MTEQQFNDQSFQVPSHSSAVADPTSCTSCTNYTKMRACQARRRCADDASQCSFCTSCTYSVAAHTHTLRAHSHSPFMHSRIKFMCRQLILTSGWGCRYGEVQRERERERENTRACARQRDPACRFCRAGHCVRVYGIRMTEVLRTKKPKKKPKRRRTRLRCSLSSLGFTRARKSCRTFRPG